MSFDFEGMSPEQIGDRLAHDFEYIQSNNGRLPARAYWARLRTFPTLFHEYIELAPADDGKGWEVLMDFKPASDPFYGNLWGTQGMTVMMGQMAANLVSQHAADESGIPVKQDDFRLCAVVTDAKSPRHHANVNVFGRLLPGKPKTYNGAWLSVDKLDDLAVIPLCRTYLKQVTAVLLHGASPTFVEHREFFEYLD